MITYIKGNIFDSSMGCLINPVNCVGVMGKGLALEFKRRYPDMFYDYQHRCARGLVKTGIPYIYHDKSGIKIVNFPTKNHWMQNSNLQYIEDGLFYLVCQLERWDIQSVAMPPLGCGNGKLEWLDVKDIVVNTLRDVDIPIEIYHP